MLTTHFTRNIQYENLSGKNSIVQGIMYHNNAVYLLIQYFLYVVLSWYIFH